MALTPQEAVSKVTPPAEWVAVELIANEHEAYLLKILSEVPLI
jgi:hypothetical protein